MKKILSFLCLAFVALAFVSCSKNTPEAVVKEYIVDIQKGQYEDALDLFYFKTAPSADEKEQYVALFRDKVSKDIDQKDGIAGYEITSTEMGEDGLSAKVTYILKYGDGSTDEKTGGLVNVDGKWMLDSGK